MQQTDITIALAGDLILTRPWSKNRDPEFLNMIEILRNADVSIANLDTLIHTFKGYPENNDQGSHMASDPAIAKEIAWAGINMVSGANNHANDYGVIGTLENIQFITESGISIAGVGKDLQQARKPAFYGDKQKVALLAATSTFDSWAKASMSMETVAGRPGINPITVKATYSLIYQFARFVYNTLMKRGVILKSPKKKNIQVGNKNISIGREFKGKYVPDMSDITKNLELVKRARKEADLVVFSFHSHEGSQSTPPDFMQKFAYDAIDAGLDLFFSHGPHYVKGIEIYKGKPVFYGLGNFVFEAESIAKLPSQDYDKWNLDYSLSAEELFRRTEKEFIVVRKYWEGILPVVRFTGTKITEIVIHPLSLGYGEAIDMRGTPSIANPSDGERIIKRLNELSAPYKTKIEYDHSENFGIIRF